MKLLKYQRNLSPFYKNFTQSLSEIKNRILLKKKKCFHHILLLNFVVVLWGTQHVVMEKVVKDNITSVARFTFCRFFIAAILSSVNLPLMKVMIRRMLPFCFTMTTTTLSSSSLAVPVKEATTTKRTKTILHTDSLPLFIDKAGNGMGDSGTSSSWTWGVEMGMWMFLGFALEELSLTFATVRRFEFILLLNFKFVPLFARVLLGRKITAATWTSVLLSILGMSLMEHDASPLLNNRDLWTIVASAASDMFIFRLESASRNIPDASWLNSTCLWTVAVATAVWTIAESPGVENLLSVEGLLHPGMILYESVREHLCEHPLAVLYLAGVTTALGNYLQVVAQRGVTAERACIIFSMDPVYDAIFDGVFLGEAVLGFRGVVGAVMIFVTTVINSLVDLGTMKEV